MGSSPTGGPSPTLPSRLVCLSHRFCRFIRPRRSSLTCFEGFPHQSFASRKISKSTANSTGRRKQHCGGAVACFGASPLTEQRLG
ncbi:POX [Musa troglodytarum]|uniref:POX n=1 Tax=Musa troglodytarum TaxID=320322 RepID=A0A9E7L6M7_9LILI|nr:POX [Musa troglodytarum]